MASSEPEALSEEARLICAILAEQVAALCEGIAASAVFNKLTACGDILASLASQLEVGSAASRAAAQLDKAMDDLGFQHAQQQDFAHQTAELVAGALKTLATGEWRKLSLGGLAALYVSESQRRLHDIVLAERTGRRNMTTPDL